LCAEYNAGLILMHMKGSPDSMQKLPRYKDVVKEVFLYLKKATSLALEAGVKPDNIIVDPGIGFGKNLAHNISLIKNLKTFRKLGFPILVGLSRKSFLGMVTGLDVNERLIPSIVANSIGIINGADMIRVHDIKESSLSAKVIDAIMK
ncbi:MAG: dihydropteroate synthase, partial [Candidatus Omnitrophota bacterium]